MELCYCNLEEYIIKRENNLSINEIKEVLIQLNNSFKIIEKEKLIYKDLKPSNILISINKLDKCLIKLNKIANKLVNVQLTSMSIKGAPLTTSPEILNGEDNNNKCDIWSLGIIIYFMLFKEYPYTGKNEILLIKDIMSNKNLKLSEDNNLNDLINKMLKINANERISWEEYFNHPFFKEDKINLKCNKHNNSIFYYCKSCNNSICDNCLKEHLFHEIFPFNKIELNENEINKIEDLLKDINDKFNKLNKFKENIDNYIKYKRKLLKENKSKYENDTFNVYKENTIEYIGIIKNKLKEINLNDILKQNNYIISVYDINKDGCLNSPIQILNSYEEIKRGHPHWKLEGSSENEKEIKEKCEIYLNDNINFCYKYQFLKKGKFNFKMIFNIPLTNTNLMFYDCNKLLSLDLSNFNTNNTNNMSCMFSGCSSLTSLILSKFNTENVENMSYMFSNCSSLTSLDLSNFNTNNVINMSQMFSNCSSLTSLDLSNFNTDNVNNMSYMFSDCSSLTSLDLSNFNTSKIKDMSWIFRNCSSLTSLNTKDEKIVNKCKSN